MTIPEVLGTLFFEFMTPVIRTQTSHFKKLTRKDLEYSPSLPFPSPLTYECSCTRHFNGENLEGCFCLQQPIRKQKASKGLPEICCALDNFPHKQSGDSFKEKMPLAFLRVRVIFLQNHNLSLALSFPYAKLKYMWFYFCITFLNKPTRVWVPV